MNKKKLLKIALPIVAVALIVIGLIDQRVELINDTVTHEAGQKLVMDATQYFNVDEEKAKEFEFDTSTVDADRVGEYEVLATYKNKEFTLKVNVVDTTAPMVEFSQRCVFTNNLVNTDITNALEGIYDASEYTTKLIRFEHAGNLDMMDEKAVKELTDKIPLPCDEDELMTIGTEEVPEEDGIYRSVLEIKDIHGNMRLEEVYVVYDTMGAKIEDVPDKTVCVAKEDLDKVPELDKSEYKIKDNVDGRVNEEDIVCELELRDKDKHEWLVHVSYTDRAGNESKADFLIFVKEKSANSKSEVGSSSEPNETSSSSITNSQTSNDDERNISSYEQMVIDAGYGNVVQIDSNTYAVLTRGDGLVNGMDGGLFLYQHLKTLGLYPNSVTGGWIDSVNDWYWYIAKKVVVIPSTPVEPGGSTNIPEGVPDDVIWVN